jgi:hypothetical protein
MAKKGSRLLEPSTTLNTHQPGKPRPMGSNFNDIQLRPGISILEGGKVKQNKQSLSNAQEHKLSMEDYQSMKMGQSLSQMAESRVQSMGEKSFSLP